jgi:hypothetical protein
MSDAKAPAARWFSRVVWLGIGANLLLAIPTLAAPERLLALSRLPAAEPILWPQFAALLLILLSAAYVPAALDPDRYRLVAWIAVASRLAGVVFFLGWQPRAYHPLGYFDLAFFVPQCVLLAAMGSAASGQLARAVSRPAPVEGGR